MGHPFACTCSIFIAFIDRLRSEFFETHLFLFSYIYPTLHSFCGAPSVCTVFHKKSILTMADVSIGTKEVSIVGGQVQTGRCSCARTIYRTFELGKKLYCAQEERKEMRDAFSVCSSDIALNSVICTIWCTVFLVSVSSFATSRFFAFFCFWHPFTSPTSQSELFTDPGSYTNRAYRCPQSYSVRSKLHLFIPSLSHNISSPLTTYKYIHTLPVLQWSWLKWWSWAKRSFTGNGWASICKKGKWCCLQDDSRRKNCRESNIIGWKARNWQGRHNEISKISSN